MFWELEAFENFAFPFIQQQLKSLSLCHWVNISTFIKDILPCANSAESHFGLNVFCRFCRRLIARHQWCDQTSEVKRLCFSDRYMLVRADNFEPGLVLIDAGTKGGLSLSLSGNHFQLMSYYLKRAERKTNL